MASIGRRSTRAASASTRCCASSPIRPPHSRSTEAQRAAVGYAEQYALDPHGLRDSDFEALHEYFADAQLATLTLAVAMYDALARFSVALEV